jgi:hypothetical protein
MAGPFTTPVAFSTPFLSEPDRSNGFTSKNVQEAIEEALDQAIANDKFLILSQYNGNASAGRLLEFYNGIDSEDAPLYFTTQSRIVSIVCSTTKPNSSATIGFYNLTNDPNMNTPLYILDMNGQKRKIDNGTTLFTMPAGGNLAIKVFSGSIGKPHIQLTFSSTI